MSCEITIIYPVNIGYLILNIFSKQLQHFCTKLPFLYIISIKPYSLSKCEHYAGLA